MQEKRVYDEVHKYLTKNTYSTSATKVETATVRRKAKAKAKNVQVLDGILYYTGPKGDAKKQLNKQSSNRNQNTRVIFRNKGENIRGLS